MGHVLEDLEDQIKGNCEPEDEAVLLQGLDVFALSKEEVLLESYALATDDRGELFLNYIAERQKEKLPIGIAEDLFESYKDVETATAGYGGLEETVVKAREMLAGVKSEANAKEAELPDTSFIDCILESTYQVMREGILNTVFADTSFLSDKASQVTKDLIARSKEEGNLYLKTGNDWYRKILVLSYLEDYFSCYTAPRKEHYLNYEMEYLIGGRGSERENLSATLNRILLIREAANVAYLLQDREKMAFVESMAAIIGVLAGENPAVVKVAELGLVAAWAYMESVLDVRSLVTDGRIPLMKEAREWNANSFNLIGLFDKGVKAKDCERGWTYVDYLKAILFLEDNQRLSYRMLEVMELGLQQQKEFSNCRMDHMIAGLRFKVKVKATPLFSTLIPVGETYKGKYIFTKEAERLYVP